MRQLFLQLALSSLGMLTHLLMWYLPNLMKFPIRKFILFEILASPFCLGVI